MWMFVCGFAWMLCGWASLCVWIVDACVDETQRGGRQRGGDREGWVACPRGSKSEADLGYPARRVMGSGGGRWRERGRCLTCPIATARLHHWGKQGK